MSSWEGGQRMRWKWRITVLVDFRLRSTFPWVNGGNTDIPGMKASPYYLSEDSWHGLVYRGKLESRFVWDRQGSGAAVRSSLPPWWSGPGVGSSLSPTRLTQAKWHTALSWSGSRQKSTHLVPFSRFSLGEMFTKSKQHGGKIRSCNILSWGYGETKT